MTGRGELRVGFVLGLIGALLMVLGSLVALTLGAADAILGRPWGAVAHVSDAIVLFVVGLLAAVFAILGARPWRDRPFGSGIVLVVLSVIGWGFLGFGASLLAALGAILVLLSGILYLVATTHR